MTASQSSSLPTALVTGATSGIGRATAVALAEKGFTVVVHGRDAGSGEAVAKEITATGGRARFVAAERGTRRTSGASPRRPARWTSW
jgi:NAD(P)-dependent dehydrogenase (short-subunit alcohol dehydrogenase family)